MRQRHYLKIFLLALLSCGLLLSVSMLPVAQRAFAASAHAFVIGSDPVDGSTVSTLPHIMRIYFDAPIGAVSQARVYAFPSDAPPDGILVNAGPSVVNAQSPRELDTPLLVSDRLPQGGYEVRWTALSMTDGQTTSGLIGFNLGQSSLGLAGQPTLGPGTSNYFPQLDFQGWLTVIWNWLELLVLLLWVGILVTDYLIVPYAIPQTIQTQIRKHTPPLLIFCLTTLLVSGTVNLVLRMTHFSYALGENGFNLSAVSQLVLHTNYGHFWLIRMGLLLLAVLFLWWTSYRPPLSEGKSDGLSVFRGKKGFVQLRQQMRTMPSLEKSVDTTSTSSASLAHGQARVTGAVATTSLTRGTTSAIPRVTDTFENTTDTEHLPSWWQALIWFFLVGLVILTLAFSNELISLAPLPMSATVLGWLSLVVQGIWFGCMAYIGFALFTRLAATDPDRYSEMVVAVLKCTKPLLLPSIGILLVCELFLGESTLHTPAQFLNDPYGRSFMGELLLILLMLIFTCYTLFYLMPRLQRQTILLPVVAAEMPARRARKVAIDKTAHTIGRALSLLTCLATVVLLCQSLMSFFSPPVVFPAIDYSAVLAAQNAEPVPTVQNQQQGNLVATFEVTPARIDTANTVLVKLNDTQGKPVSDAQVRISVNMVIMNMGQVGTVASHESSATYRAVFDPTQSFTMEGAWAVEVEVTRAGQPEIQFVFHVIISS